MLLNSAHDAHSLTEIAYRVGFNSSSHFSTKFHRKFGLRPSDVKPALQRQLLGNHLDPVPGHPVRRRQGAISVACPAFMAVASILMHSSTVGSNRGSATILICSFRPAAELA
jgi:AraC-like DNA-binding protein